MNENSEALAHEQASHDAFYGERAAQGFSTKKFEARAAYPWQSRFNLYSDEHRRFMRQALAIAKSPVLEVGCGRRELS